VVQTFRDIELWAPVNDLSWHRRPALRYIASAHSAVRAPLGRSCTDRRQ
jgi:hypothetical protein